MADTMSAVPSDTTLAVIGGGKMGEAIVAGLLASGALSADRIRIAEPNEARRDVLTAAYGIACHRDGSDAVAGADVVLMAVKPQVMDGVLGTLAPSIDSATVISIAAGITCARLESLLPAGVAVVRVMPNTPALVGECMALVSGGSAASAAQVALVVALFSSVGRAIVVSEAQQDAGSAISGSGPAYFALVIDALARAGVAQGLPREVAQELAVQTMRGTAVMLAETGMHPGELIDGVSSPGGTTIAALDRLEAGGVRAAFSDAVAAAVRRSAELGA